MEIEAKFRIEDPTIFSTLIRLNRLANYRLVPAPHIEQQHNIYYDSADRRLQSARYGLRTREVDGRCVVTLKGPNQAHGGVHQRAEWEFVANNPDPNTWPDGEARTHVLELLDGAPLQPILTIHTNRRHVIASYQNQDVAELSLDEGTIDAAGRTQDFRELEIELLPDGRRADLDALITALQEFAVIIPEERSKLERGLTLLHNNREKEV